MTPPTKQPLRVLQVEDNEDDAMLVLLELQRAGFNVTSERVETSEDMTRALLTKDWDAVVSDWSLPKFNGLLAFRLMKGLGLDLPFVIVSGTIGEETAVEAMHAGVHDFMLKSQLTRLVPAIERERREAQIRAEGRSMQAQLMISDRMATVGTLAAGVAHEINNPLSAVVANLELAAREAADLVAKSGGSTELIDELHDAREAAERIRLIVRDLKIFSRGDSEESALVDLHRVLESTLRMAGNEVRHRARIVKDFGVVPMVAASEARLGQVFLNLVMNAAQAIPEGNYEMNEIRLVTSTNSLGHAVVEVKDTGPGISPEVLPRLFTPFFTTKPVGVGTGLGLSICHRIITGLGGQIHVSTELGRGTTFRVALPPGVAPAPEAVKPAPVPVPKPVENAPRRGKILVVDDETAIGAAIRRTLGRDHDVTVLSHARDALDKVAAGERYDVVLCDLMMPEVTGMDLHDELARTCPEQLERVIFMSGGAFTQRAQAFLEEIGSRRLDKPFDPKTLRTAVQDLMNGTRRG